MSFIIPFFIPHQGCPHTCLFCNQHSITGKKTDQMSNTLDEVMAEWLPRKKGSAAQLAFYGGSFSCLPQKVQSNYLAQAQPYIENGSIDSIRISTRPDCISKDICQRLWRGGVRTIELGIQSMDDKVLTTALRGHSADESKQALQCLAQFDFTVGVQLLPGLPGETWRSFSRTIEQIIDLKPAIVRLYPALVIRGSGLEELYAAGKYKPLSLNKAVAWSLAAKKRFEENGIQVIRIGLQHSTDLEQSYIAGPHHSAMGELVESRRWFKKIRKIIRRNGGEKILRCRVSPKDISAINGPKRVNLKRLESLGMLAKVKFEQDKEIERGSIVYVVGK